MVKPAPEVEARAERAAGAAEDDDLDLGLRHGAMHGGLELVGHRRDDRVQPLGPVERDRRDRAFGAVENRLVTHETDLCHAERYGAGTIRMYGRGDSQPSG